MTEYELTRNIPPLAKGHRVVPTVHTTVWNDNPKMMWVASPDDPIRPFVVRPEEIIEVES